MEKDNKNRSGSLIDENSIIEEFLNRMNDKISKINLRQRRLYFETTNDNLIEVAEYLFKNMHCRLSTATAMETYSSFEVLYHFSLDSAGFYFCPRVLIPDKANPHINSISPIIKGAEWIEREIHELWGITFTGHPRPEPLLTGNHPKAIKVPLRFGSKVKEGVK